MIQKYTYGKPIETEAVIEKQVTQKTKLPYFQIQEEPLVFLYEMGENDIIYGLGQQVRGINKRGWVYESKCSDDPAHREDTRALYGAHNLLIVDGKETFGVFFDYPSNLKFDIGYTNHNQLMIMPQDGNLDVYILIGDSPMDIIKEFRRIIGMSYIPPKWAFGYGQSRWSYMNAEEVREIVKEHRENQIPLDSVYMDIDYMERYKDFTVNEEAFPNLKEFSEEMKNQGIHLVPIIDAGVKIEEGYDLYEEGMEKGYFCKEENGEEFVAGVWPGRVHFPDMLNEDVRKWFGQKYQILLNQGIDGFWNDMNEPAIFYSENNLKKVFAKLDSYKGENLDIYSFFELKDMILGIANNEEDYKSFYHNYHGEIIRHDKVHNLYGFNMTRAAGEALEEMEPEKRILLFSRSSYVGMHRYGGIWTGDNLSWWSHLLLNIRMMPSLNMCGFIYTGADIGGFGADTTEDLMLRWLGFGIFTPLMRNHSAMGTRRQEAFRFDDLDAFRNIIGIRYGLMPYIYSEYMKAVLRDDMYFKPLSFVYPKDTFAKQVEDQLMLGESVMIAPVYEQNAKGRYVYLPETMKMVKMKSLHNRTSQIMEKGHHYVEIALDEVVIFIRPDHLVPLSTGGQFIEEIDFSTIVVIGFVETSASYELYDDDGYKKDYHNPDNCSVIQVDENGAVHISGDHNKKVTFMN